MRDSVFHAINANLKNRLVVVVVLDLSIQAFDTALDHAAGTLQVCNCTRKSRAKALIV